MILAKNKQNYYVISTKSLQLLQNNHIKSTKIMEVTSKNTKRRVYKFLKIHYSINKNNVKSTKLYQHNGIFLKFQNNQPKNFNLLQI